jgi:hypothetical protein
LGLHELAWDRFEYERNRIYYDTIFSTIQKNRNLKPNPYLVDTVEHLFATALGAAPGHVPSTDNNSLPTHLLQQAFVTSYGLKKYFPTIMKPHHFNFELDLFPIYYSLQNPTTRVFSPRSRTGASTIKEIRELERLMNIFIEELSKNGALSSDTVMGHIAKLIKFHYFHNMTDNHNITRNSLDMLSIDSRFCKTLFPSAPEAVFAEDSSFLRGCVSISSTDIPANKKTQNTNKSAAIP